MRVVRALIDSKSISIETAIRNIAQVPMALDDELWNGLLWDSTNKRILATSEGKRAAWKLMFYAAGGDLAYLRITSSSLTKELAGLLNKEEGDVKLRAFVSSG